MALKTLKPVTDKGLSDAIEPLLALWLFRSEIPIECETTERPGKVRFVNPHDAAASSAVTALLHRLC